MPGLVGIISENGIDKQLLNRMVDSLKHKEFHRVDRYIDSHLGVARVHLGIFNPEPQPIFNEDNSLCIFMDGKTYDYEEQLNELKNKGHKFNNENDPEFCLHSYEDYGIDFVKNLNGSFVFLICDLRENKIIIVNDRYGLRPLYYAINNGKLLFSSEVKAILEDKSFKKELNDETVADFIAFGEILGNKTFFNGVELIPPASVFTYCDGKYSIDQYWNFVYTPDYTLSKEDIVDKLLKSFKKAVEIRLKDNYKYGLSLSGGLDSRLIVAAIDKNMRHNITTFTFGPLNCSDVKIGKKVSSEAGMKHKAVKLTPENIIENAEDVIYLTDGMGFIGFGHNLTDYKGINKYINVVFNGLALDLTLGGSYLNKKILNAKNDKELFDILYEAMRLFSDEELSNLFNGEYYKKVNKFPLLSFTKSFNKVQENSLGNKRDHFAIQNHVRRWTLMAHIICRNFMEDLIPSFDNNFVDVILKIPPELRISRYIQRELLKRMSPELAKIHNDKTMIRTDAPLVFWKMGTTLQFAKRKIKRIIWKASKGKIFLANKQNFVEFDDWLRTNKNWERFFTELLLSKEARSKVYFSQEYIKVLIQEHIDGKSNNSSKILYIASFEIFLRLFFRIHL